jgi:membrane-bound lytic murein transglycosylase D
MKIFVSIFLLGSSLFVQAAPDDTLRVKKIRRDDPVLTAMDSLESLNYLSVEKFSVTRNKTKYPLPADSVPMPDAATIAARLKKLDARSPMDLTYNEDVQAYIDLYLVKARKVTSKLIGLTEIYNPMFEQMLDKYDIPLELKYLPIIESALNPSVKSWAGAVGLWQFMYPTGKMYGLEVNSYIDERCDPIKETEAACKFLKYLYNWYHDWNLALAAYNAGPGTINNAIRRSGGKTNYWEIFPYIPKETRGYVPAFIAANYFMNYYVEHNLVPYDTKKQYFAFDTVHVDKRLDLKHVSAVLKIDLEDLQYMNPVYKTTIVPGDDKKMHIFLPKNKIADFILFSDSIYNYNGNPQLAAASSEPVKQYTKVRYNETLKAMSLRTGTTVADLKKWNNIKGNYVKNGRWLVYYQGGTPGENTSGSNENTGNTAENNNTKTNNNTVTPPSPKFAYYTIKNGDTLYKIAERKAVSATGIKKLNPAVNWNRLQVGQKIKIPSKG